MGHWEINPKGEMHSITGLSKKQKQQQQTPPHTKKIHKQEKVHINNQWVNNKIKEEIKRYLEANENEKTKIQHLWDTGKALFRGKFIALQAYLKNTQKSSNK